MSRHLLLSAARARTGYACCGARPVRVRRYNSALKLLDRLSGTSSEDQQSIELYRSLCLLAVGRTQDAERSVEMIIAHPLYASLVMICRHGCAPRSARRRSASCHRSCSSIRRREGRVRKEGVRVGSIRFRRVMDALNDPDMGSAASKPPLAGLRIWLQAFTI